MSFGSYPVYAEQMGQQSLDSTSGYSLVSRPAEKKHSLAVNLVSHSRMLMETFVRLV